MYCTEVTRFFHLDILLSRLLQKMSNLSRRSIVGPRESGLADVGAHSSDSVVEIEVSNDLSVTDEWFE